MSKSEGYLKGQRDCRKGEPHKNGSDAYNRGYSDQYQREVLEEKRNEFCKRDMA
jgi:hypothetical protein